MLPELSELSQRDIFIVWMCHPVPQCDYIWEAYVIVKIESVEVRRKGTTRKLPPRYLASMKMKRSLSTQVIDKVNSVIKYLVTYFHVSVRCQWYILGEVRRHDVRQLGLWTFHKSTSLKSLYQCTCLIQILYRGGLKFCSAHSLVWWIVFLQLLSASVSMGRSS